jgi:hypothetical protein
MNEEQFRQRAQEQGYGDFQTKDYVPNKDGPLHMNRYPFDGRHDRAQALPTAGRRGRVIRTRRRPAVDNA